MGYSGGGPKFWPPHAVVVWGRADEEETAQVRGAALPRALSHTSKALRRNNEEPTLCESS